MLRALTALIAATLLLAGCGGGGDDGSTAGGQSARDAAQGYVDAFNARDAAKVCALYSDQLTKGLSESDCEDYVPKQASGTASKITLGDVQESGDHAVATIQGSEGDRAAHLEVTLERQNGQWKITNLRATGGGP
jgi:ketosteroid isomerase-like protein